MGAKKFSDTHRSTMCGLMKLASGVFPESWKVLAAVVVAAETVAAEMAAERDQKQCLPVTRGDLMRNQRNELYWEQANKTNGRKKCNHYIQ